MWLYEFLALAYGKCPSPGRQSHTNQREVSSTKTDDYSIAGNQFQGFRRDLKNAIRIRPDVAFPVIGGVQNRRAGLANIMSLLRAGKRARCGRPRQIGPSAALPPKQGIEPVAGRRKGSRASSLDTLVGRSVSGAAEIAATSPEPIQTHVSVIVIAEVRCE